MNKYISFIVLIVAKFTLGCTPSESRNPALVTETDGRVHTLLEFADLKSDFEVIRVAMGKAHAPVAAELGKIRFVQVDEHVIAADVPADSPALDVVNDALKRNAIRHAEPDFMNVSTELKEDSAISFEPNSTIQDNGELDKGPTAYGSHTVIVAVIDTGVDYTHRDLAPYIWRNSKEIAGNRRDDDGNGYIDDTTGWDFANNDNNPMADDRRSYHGTHVAGIVKQASKLISSGINLKIMPIKYLDSTSTGRTSDALRAIDYAVQNGAMILNNSWGSNNMSQNLSNAIERARQKGVLFVAAAGNGDNHGRGINLDLHPFYPASFNHNNVISVAASDTYNRLTAWSNYGGVRVDLSAPGSQIRSTRNGNSYANLSGTSMASPHIAGVAASLWALRPSMNYLQLRAILFETVDRFSSMNGKLYTSGKVNAERSASRARVINLNSTEL